MALSPRSFRSREMLSEINVTPLVDVMLVLLIIFMVTTPLLEQGIPITLPQTITTALEPDQKQLTLTVTKSKELYLAKEKISLLLLPEKLKTLISLDPRREIFVRADKEVPYGFVAEVMAEMRTVGITRIGLVTIPLPTER